MIGERLRIHRELYGLTQEQVAKQLQLSRNYISQIERGLANNLSFTIVQQILSLGKSHGQIQVTLTRRVTLDAAIAPEVVWLNSQGVETAGCCAGPPPTALIPPSSAEQAKRLGYEPKYHDSAGLFEIILKSTVPT